MFNDEIAKSICYKALGFNSSLRPQRGKPRGAPAIPSMFVMVFLSPVLIHITSTFSVNTNVDGKRKII